MAGLNLPKKWAIIGYIVHCAHQTTIMTTNRPIYVRHFILPDFVSSDPLFNTEHWNKNRTIY